MKITFTEHIPAFVEGCEPKTLTFRSLDELLENQKDWLESKQHGELVFSCDCNYLMISSKTEQWWWVLGYVEGINLTSFLPKYDEVFEGQTGEA